MFRVGHGYDCHTFTDGNCVTIGGCKIPFTKGIKAHSDGDVLFHAIGDALLGAAALGDLGQHFPDNDPQFKAIPSSELLIKIIGMLNEYHFNVNNIDATVIVEAPKLAEFIPAMRNHIAEILNVDPSYVSVKATTNEKMGWIGRGEGIAAHAVVMLCQ